MFYDFSLAILMPQPNGKMCDSLNLHTIDKKFM